jgi:hypothetical protein
VDLILLPNPALAQVKDDQRCMLHAARRRTRQSRQRICGRVRGPRRSAPSRGRIARSSPLGLAAGAGAAVLAGAFVVDWHRALQFLGVLGPLTTAAGRALQYDSPQARPGLAPVQHAKCCVLSAFGAQPRTPATPAPRGLLVQNGAALA